MYTDDENPEITNLMEKAKTIIGDLDVKELTIEEQETIATTLFSKLKPFDVKKVTIRDIERVFVTTLFHLSSLGVPLNRLWQSMLQ